MIKVVTIDFWNTIFDSSNGNLRNKYRQRVLIQTIDQHNVTIKEEEFNDAMKASWEYFNNIWRNEHRTPTPKETVEFFWNYLHLPPDELAIEELTREFGECVLLYPPSLMSGFKENLALLAKKFPLAVISDTGFSPGTILKELLKLENVLDYFDSFSFSDETGVSKPHKNAYYKVLNELKCHPENAVHIGDIESTDILGAKNIGMKAIRFSSDAPNIFSKENPDTSLADFIAKSWDEIPSLIDILNNQ